MNLHPDVDTMGAEAGPASPAHTTSLKKLVTLTPLPIPKSRTDQDNVQHPAGSGYVILSSSLLVPS